MRCWVRKSANGWSWEWRCPACSDKYPFGGGSVTFAATIYAVNLHARTVHRP